MQPFAFDPRGFQDFVVSFSEVHRACEVPIVVAHEGRIFVEVGFFAQILDRLDRGIVERHVAPWGKMRGSNEVDLFSFLPMVQFSGRGN